MEWQQLVYFKCVASTENMGEAAKILHISQPALSTAIKNLEKELEVPLFERKKNKIYLNKYGSAFLFRVDKVLSEIEAARKELRTMRETELNKVTVMCPITFMTPEFMNYLYEKIPNIVIENRHIDHSAAKDGLLDGTLDLCVLSPPVVGKKIETIPLELQRMVIITSATHRLASVDEISFAELSEEKFAAYAENTGPRADFEEKCRRRGFKPNIVFESNSIRDMINPVKAGRGILYSSVEALSMYSQEGLHIIRLKDEDATTVLGLSIRNDKPIRPLAETLKNTIIEFFKNKNNGGL